jgi:hypothetical protein
MKELLSSAVEKKQVKRAEPERRKTMPNINSYADLVRDLESLLRAFEDNYSILAPAEPQRDAVNASLIELQDVKALQDSFAAQRQQATQQLQMAMLRAREEARRLRGMAKGLLGTKNERLVQFRVAPNRSRARLVPEAPPPPPPPPPVE